MKTVREFLIEYNKKKGWGTTEEELIETLTEHGKEVYKEELNSHRWYATFWVVTMIDSLYIRYLDYYITGDAGMYDMGLEYDLDLAHFVERKERQAIQVYYEIPSED